jgi:calcium-dependent protein kinase
MAVPQVRSPCKPSKGNQENNNQRVTFGGETLSSRSVEHVIHEEEEKEEEEEEEGFENHEYDAVGGGNASSSSQRSSTRSSTRSPNSSSHRTREIDYSPPPPSVSERSTSPSLPRKVRKESDGSKRVVSIFNKNQTRKVAMSTPNLLTLAVANNDIDNDNESSSLSEEFNININNNTASTAATLVVGGGGSLREREGGGPSSPIKSSKMKRSKSELILLSPEFRTNLMQEKQNDRDPLFYYQVTKTTLGTGSMGSVALVQKRHAAVGGSARKKVRDTIQNHKRKQECFKLPFGIGGIFKFCIGDKDLRPVSIKNTSTTAPLSTPKSNNKGRRGRGDGGNDTGNNSSLKETLLSTIDTWTSSSGIISSGVVSAISSTTTSDRQSQYGSSKSNSSILNTPTILEEPDDDDDDTLDNLYDDDNSNNSDDDGSKRTTSSVSDHEYAMKSIHLSRVTDDSFVQELKNEIAILKKLDHPHIVRPIETYQYKNQIFIIMEVCSGGDLYSRDPYTEEEAARIISSVLSAVSYLHSNNVAHRDLKYENILFVNESPKAEIKLIDFGLSKIYGNAVGTNGRSATLTEGVGTIYTMAPEVLKGSYTKQADVWSVGVIAYMLLSSQMPFYGRKRQHIVEQILGGKYDFRGRRWRKIGEPAKDFVRDLLVIDPDERLDAERASSCVWLNKRFAATVRGPREKEIRSARKSMTRYAGYTKLKKMALMVVAHRSTCEEIGILRKVFQKYASNNNNGCISYEEFRDAWKESGLPPEDTKSVFDAVVSSVLFSSYDLI